MERKYKELVEKLIDKTKSKKLNWEETSSSNCFLIKIGPNSITIREDDSPFAEKQDIIISLMDLLGTRIDQYLVPCTDEDYSLACELYCAAKRSTTHVDEAIEEIMNNLNFLV